MTVYVAKGTELYQRPDEPNPSTPPEDGGGDGGTNPPPDDPGGGTGGTVTARTNKPFWWPPNAAFPPTGYAAPTGWPTDFYFPGPPFPPGWDTSDIPDWWPNTNSTALGMWAYSEAIRSGSNGQAWSGSMPPGPPYPPLWYFENETKMQGWYRLLGAVEVPHSNNMREVYESFQSSFGVNEYPDIYKPTVGPIEYFTDPSTGAASTYNVNANDLVSVSYSEGSGAYRLHGPPFPSYINRQLIQRYHFLPTISSWTWFCPQYSWDTDTNNWTYDHLMYLNWNFVAVDGITNIDQAYYNGWRNADFDGVFLTGLIPGSGGDLGPISLGETDILAIDTPSRADTISKGIALGWLNPDGSPIESV